MVLKRLLSGIFVLLSTALYSQLVITEVYYDTPYTEYYNYGFPSRAHHLGEYIELYNYTDEDIPLKGWSITDYVSKYIFPDNAVIEAESFIIVAYRDLYYGPETGYYFPDFFPTTQGKEAQIFYQGSLMLRNQREVLNINMGNLRGIEFNEYPIFTTNYSDWSAASNYDNSPNVNYYGNSKHLQSDYSLANGTATPLSANFVPPTKRLEDIPAFQEAILLNTGNYTWDYQAQRLLEATCSTVITTVEQFPSGIYLPEGKCFTYDASGNYVSAIDCSDEDEEDENSPDSSNYDQDELDDIASKISIYPNPTPSVANISWEDSVIGKITAIQVANVSGVSIGYVTVNNMDTSASFDISNQPATFYIVTFTLDTGQMISKNLIKI